MNDETISIENFTSDDELEELEELPILYLIKTLRFAVFHFC